MKSELEWLVGRLGWSFSLLNIIVGSSLRDVQELWHFLLNVAKRTSVQSGCYLMRTVVFLNIEFHSHPISVCRRILKDSFFIAERRLVFANVA